MFKKCASGCMFFWLMALLLNTIRTYVWFGRLAWSSLVIMIGRLISSGKAGYDMTLWSWFSLEFFQKVNKRESKVAWSVKLVMAIGGNVSYHSYFYTFRLTLHMHEFAYCSGFLSGCNKWSKFHSSRDSWTNSWSQFVIVSHRYVWVNLATVWE